MNSGGTKTSRSLMVSQLVSKTMVSPWAAYPGDLIFFIEAQKFVPKPAPGDLICLTLGEELCCIRQYRAGGGMPDYFRGVMEHWAI